MKTRETVEPGGPLVDLRIVFHCARAERIHSAVDREVLLAEPDVVPKHFGFTDFREGGRPLSRERAIHLSRVNFGNITGWQRRGATVVLPLFEDQRRLKR